MRAFDAVLVDAGGVLVLPDRAAVSTALGPGAWNEAPEVLDRAHYRAVAAVDRARPDSDRAIFPTYVAAYLEALEVAPGRRDLVNALAAIFDVGTPTWTTVISESAAALRTIARDHRVVVVSNSQGWMDATSEMPASARLGLGPAPLSPLLSTPRTSVPKSLTRASSAPPSKLSE
jgi:hypothetical protein